MEFGEYLRQTRREKNFKTIQLANLLGISASYLSSLESGSRTPPSFELVKKMADLLELAPAERHRLYDLAAECKKPPGLATDLNDYICQTPNLRSLLRYTMDCRLTEQDWEVITAFIKKNYFY